MNPSVQSKACEGLLETHPPGAPGPSQPSRLALGKGEGACFSGAGPPPEKAVTEGLGSEDAETRRHIKKDRRGHLGPSRTTVKKQSRSAFGEL